MKYLLILISVSLVLNSTSPAYKRLEDGLKEAIIRHYSCDDVRIENLRFSESSESEPREIDMKETAHGLTVFNIKLADGKTIRATAKITLLGKTVVSKRPLKKGTALSEGDIEVRLIDLKRIPPGAFREKEEVMGKIINRSLSYRVIITKEMVSKAISVKRGKKILIIAESPHFRISVPGELRDNAVIGDFAKAVNLQTKKTVTGILIDEDTLRVEF